MHDIVGKKKANALEKRGIHKGTLLHAYHAIDRPYKDFKGIVDEALDELDETLTDVDKVIEMTKEQLRLYDNLKQSFVIDRIKKIKRKRE